MSHDLSHDLSHSTQPLAPGHQLAARLREGTQQSHTSAENTAYMKCFLKGIVVREAFQKLLANLYWVYDALETELDRLKNHPIVGQIYFPELLRRDQLARDLAFYYGEDWPTQITPSPVTLNYLMRIHWAASEQPERLIAHAYVRYLGDLSGGQGLRTIARSALNLPADQGTRLHEFDSLPTPEAKRDFKMRYRDLLNALPLNESQVAGIVEEANLAFSLNRQLVESLEPVIQAAVNPAIFEEVVLQSRKGSTELVSVN